jgi:hypothetical protein
MVGDPRDAGSFGVLMQLVFREVMLLAQGRECLCAFRFVGARDGAGFAPVGIVAHLMQALVSFRKQSVIQTASGLQGGA